MLSETVKGKKERKVFLFMMIKSKILTCQSDAFSNAQWAGAAKCSRDR